MEFDGAGKFESGGQQRVVYGRAQNKKTTERNAVF